uniref:Uncharacterized protein n=1 Tax=Anguilla anguilla TaxID=7936 RepID=A0A0E9XUG1_ANGAN
MIFSFSSRVVVLSNFACEHSNLITVRLLPNPFTVIWKIWVFCFTACSCCSVRGVLLSLLPDCDPPIAVAAPAPTSSGLLPSLIVLLLLLKSSAAIQAALV